MKKINSILKRVVDVIGAIVGLTLCLPVFIVAAFFIRRDGGRVFFRQERIGLAGRPFLIYKFRTMHDRPVAGSQITSGHDPRITPVGGVLRRTKIDELPQLLNVLRGEMSLVGPRPEVPRYTAMWPPETGPLVLSVRPGLTDLASIIYSDEQALLADAESVEETYVGVIMPHKLALYVAYIGNTDLIGDLSLMISTVLKIIGVRRPLLGRWKAVAASLTPGSPTGP